MSYRAALLNAIKSLALLQLKTKIIEAKFSDPMKKLFELINRNILSSKVEDFIKNRRAGDRHPIITISREYGSGGSIVAQKLAPILGGNWRIFHEEIVNEIAKEARLEKKLIREIDEKHVPLIEELTEDFFGKRYMTLRSYSRHLLKILSVIGLRGNAIIIGRGAQFLFPSALKVRIIADMEDRVKTIIKFKKISEKRARLLIDKIDAERNEFNKSLYNHDQRKAHHYDLVIKISETCNLDDAAKIILSLAKNRFKI